MIDRYVENRIMNLRVMYRGELPARYIAQPAVFSPTTVTVSGPATVISQIDWIGVYVDLSGVREDVEDEQPVVAYNDVRVPIADLVMDVETMRFRIPVFKLSTVQIVLNEPAYTGEPSPNVAVTDVDWEPKEIELMGYVDEDLPNIILDIIDITDITETTTYTFDVNKYIALLNNGEQDVMLRNQVENIITVTVFTEPIITRDFEIPVEWIHFSDEAVFYGRLEEFLSDYITVTLSGIESVIDDIETESIFCSVYVDSWASMEGGEHILDVRVTEPDNTALTGVPPQVRLILTTNEPPSTAETQ
jgi:YbbR domain-containing protein